MPSSSRAAPLATASSALPPPFWRGTALPFIRWSNLLVGNIRVLDNLVKSRIAAGEVVENPASVVKELVENSLDASARRVDIEIASGGASLIRVTDDGSGVYPDDLPLAVEHFATSKISSAEDIFGISTYGFRG
ncbi:MAG: ATP-binding protein, partial [Planctomycetes bacterium]|nr:ATP-binding protein [Planctomycetota bacterium]